MIVYIIFKDIFLDICVPSLIYIIIPMPAGDEASYEGVTVHTGGEGVGQAGHHHRQHQEQVGQLHVQ